MSGNWFRSRAWFEWACSPSALIFLPQPVAAIARKSTHACHRNDGHVCAGFSRTCSARRRPAIFPKRLVDSTAGSSTHARACLCARVLGNRRSCARLCFVALQIPSPYCPRTSGIECVDNFDKLWTGATPTPPPPPIPRPLLGSPPLSSHDGMLSFQFLHRHQHAHFGWPGGPASD